MLTSAPVGELREGQALDLGGRQRALATIHVDRRGRGLPGRDVRFQMGPDPRPAERVLHPLTVERTDLVRDVVGVLDVPERPRFVRDRRLHDRHVRIGGVVRSQQLAHAGHRFDADAAPPLRRGEGPDRIAVDAVVGADVDERESRPPMGLDDLRQSAEISIEVVLPLGHLAPPRSGSHVEVPNPTVGAPLTLGDLGTPQTCSSVREEAGRQAGTMLSRRPHPRTSSLGPGTGAPCDGTFGGAVGGPRRRTRAGSRRAEEGP